MAQNATYLTGDSASAKQVAWLQVAATISVMSHHLLHSPIPAQTFDGAQLLPFQQQCNACRTA